MFPLSSASWFFVCSLFLLSFSTVFFFVGRRIPPTSYCDEFLCNHQTYKYNALMHYARYGSFNFAVICAYIGTFFLISTIGEAMDWEINLIVLLPSLLVGWFGYHVFDTIGWNTMCNDGYTSHFVRYVRWAPLFIPVFMIGGFIFTLTLYTSDTVSSEQLPIPVSFVVKEVRPVSCGTRNCSQTYYRAFSSKGEYLFPHSLITASNACEIQAIKLVDVRKRARTGEVIETKNERYVSKLFFTKECLS